MHRVDPTLDPETWQRDGWRAVRGLLDASTVAALNQATDVLEPEAPTLEVDPWVRLALNDIIAHRGLPVRENRRHSRRNRRT